MATRELTFDVIGRGRSQLEKLARDLDKVGRDVDRLDGKRAKVAVDADTAAATTRLAGVDRQADALDGRTVRVRVVVDEDRSTLAMLGRAGLGLAGGLFEAGREGLRLTGILTRLAGAGGAVAVAGGGITAAFGLAATTIAALPSLLGAAGAAGATVAVGWDGIRRAASELTDEVDGLKTSVSATFERGLLPAVRELERSDAFDVVERGMNRIATEMSEGAVATARFVSQGRGLTLIETIFNNTADALDRAGPGLGMIGTGLLEVAARRPALDGLADAAVRFGTAFEDSVTRTIADGSLDRSLGQLTGTVGELGELFVTLTEAGIRLYSRAGPGVNAFLDSVGGFLGRFNWERLGGAVGAVFDGLGETLDGVPTETIRSIEAAFERVGELFQDGDFQSDLQNILGSLPEFIDGLTTFLDVGADVLSWGSDLVQTLGGENVAWGLIGAGAAVAIWKALKTGARLWKLKDLFGGKKVDLTDLVNPLRWADLLPDLAGTGIGLLGDLIGDLFLDPELDVDWEELQEGLTDAVTSAFRDAFAALNGEGQDLTLPVSLDTAGLLTELGRLLGTAAGMALVLRVDADTAPFLASVAEALAQAAALATGTQVLLPISGDPAPFLGAVDTAVAEAIARVGAAQAVLPISGDPAPFLAAARGALAQLAAEAAGTVVVIPVSADTGPFRAEVAAAVAALRGLLAGLVFTIRITADYSGVLAALAALRGLLAGLVFTIRIVPDTSAFDDWIAGAPATPVPPVEVPIEGDDGPLRELFEFWYSLSPPSLLFPLEGEDSSLRELFEFWSSFVPASITVPIEGDNSGGMLAIQQLIAAGNAANTTATHTHLTGAALGAIAGVVAAGNAANTTARHTQTDNVAETLARILGLNRANTGSAHTVSDNVAAVAARISSLNGRNTGSTHTITTVYRTVGAGASAGAAAGQVSRAAGGAVIGFAGGGIVDDDSFASNSLLSPNRGRPGAIQAEDGSWVMPSFYGGGGGGGGGGSIPMGGIGMRFFAGGGAVIPGYAPGRDVVPALLSPGEAVLVPELVRALGAGTILRLNRAFSGRAGTVVGRLARLGGDGAAMPTFGAGQRRPITGGSGGAVPGFGPLPATSLGAAAGISERKLDELLGLLRAQRPVVVEDRSGDPVETGRAVALSLRLA